MLAVCLLRGHGVRVLFILLPLLPPPFLLPIILSAFGKFQPLTSHNPFNHLMNKHHKIVMRDKFFLLSMALLVLYKFLSRGTEYGPGIRYPVHGGSDKQWWHCLPWWKVSED